MKSLILLVCVFVSLSACQNDGNVGSGPLTLAPNVQAGFDDYKNKSSPIVFVVSTDGRSYNYRYCSPAFDQCYFSNNTSLALEDCQKYSRGVPCKIYAKETRIVWEGRKTVSSVQQARIINGLLNHSDERICGLALSIKDGAPIWDGLSALRNYVNEAKRRDLTPQSCAKLLGRKTVSSEKKPIK